MSLLFQPKTQEVRDKPVEKVQIRLSDFAEKFLCVPGDRRPFSLKDREYLRILYDYSAHNILLMCGRQVEKSSTLAIKAAILGAIHPGFKTLYVAPRFTSQTAVFSRQRFAPMCEDSEIFKKIWVDVNNIWQVRARAFKNRSYFNFASCYLSPGAARGISAHHLMIDEMQDIIPDNVIIIEECQSHAKERIDGVLIDWMYQSYSGTPTTSTNTLAQYWEESSQNEWLVKCSKCNRDIYLDDRVIQPNAFACDKCGTPFNPRKQGRWVMMRPSNQDRIGYRVPQILVPHKEPEDLYKKMISPMTTRRGFFNECLGLPYDIGALPLSDSDIARACNPLMKKMNTLEEIGKLSCPIYAGIDHGSGEGAHPSFTVVVIGAFIDKKFRILYLERFTGPKAELSEQAPLINTMLRKANVSVAVSDWGFGTTTNSLLYNKYGWTKGAPDPDHPKLIESQESGIQERASIHKTTRKMILNRTMNMTIFIEDIKQQKIVFPAYEVMGPYISDFTAIRMECDEKHEKISYTRTKADDTFHASKYCWLAYLHYQGILIPSWYSPEVVKAWRDAESSFDDEDEFRS